MITDPADREDLPPSMAPADYTTFYYPPGGDGFPFPWVAPTDQNPFFFYRPPPPPSPRSSSSISKTSILTPAIVAGVALLGSAILLVSYYRVFAKYCSAWQIFWGLSGRTGGRGGGGRGNRDDNHASGGDLEQGWLLSMNAGLEESIVKRIPVYVYRTGGEGVIGSSECVVCLGEFEQDDELRILPKCAHAFHLSCIDVWLRSHSNCPLCRAPVVLLPAAAASPPLLLTPPVQAMDHHQREDVGGEEEEHQQQHQDLRVDQEPGLPRSLSLQLDRHHRKAATKNRVVPPILKRSHSTGSNLVSYHDMLLLLSQPSQSLPPVRDSSLLLAPSNSAELSPTVLCNLRGDEHDLGYVILDFEVVESSSCSGKVVDSHDAASSSSSSGSDRSTRPLLSARKTGSFKESLKRSLSTGRVFSLSGFGRSRSQSQL